MTSRTHLLVDGAIARGSPLLDRIRATPSAVALYGDLGEQAANVGPWLLSDTTMSSLGLENANPPLRHGVSELVSDQPGTLIAAHLTGLRHLQTADGQQFFLRIADMRAWSALRTALSPSQLRAAFGPISVWRFLDRYGALRLLRPTPEAPLRDTVLPLSLDNTQLGRLMDAMLPLQLCAALEDLQEPDLRPDQLPEQFRRIEDHAVPFLRAQRIEAWRLQRSITRHIVRHGEQILSEGEFQQALREVREQANFDHFDDWHPESLTT